MRRMKRTILRAMLKQAGYEQLNKKALFDKDRGKHSKFSAIWQRMYGTRHS